MYECENCGATVEKPFDICPYCKMGLVVENTREAPPEIYEKLTAVVMYLNRLRDEFSSSKTRLDKAIEEAEAEMRELFFSLSENESPGFLRRLNRAYDRTKTPDTAAELLSILDLPDE